MINEIIKGQAIPKTTCGYHCCPQTDYHTLASAKLGVPPLTGMEIGWERNLFDFKEI
jgi:hypothetical protein